MRHGLAARSLVATAPTRLDFGGGWTDVPPYPRERGGFVCNLAIERRATVKIRALAPGETSSLVGGLPLVDAACSAAGVTDLRVELSSDFPVGAGLGGSSAAGVALAAALAAWKGVARSRSELAEASRAVETDGLKIPGGSQDHYAAAYGGALGITFGERTEVEEILLSSDTITRLEQQGLLVYTGESRISGETITAVLDAYKNCEQRVVHALDEMKSLALQMASALRDGDVDTLGTLVGEHWKYQRALHPRITTERIDAIDEAARRAGALGMKALGASGGGSVIIFTPPHARDEIAEAVRPFGEILDWRVSQSGVIVRE